AWGWQAPAGPGSAGAEDHPAIPPAASPPSPPPPLPACQHVSRPPPWHFLPVSQAELGPLFSNSSPFSFSQSLFMVPRPGQATRPHLHAAFGPHSVTQLVSEPVLPLSSLLSASLLSEHVERDKDKGKKTRFRVRTLFHRRGQTSTHGTCITLHAFRQTEEHKASCLTQPPLGLCLVTLTLPTDWFEDPPTNQSRQELVKRPTNIHPRHRLKKRERQRMGHLQGNYVNRQRMDGDTRGDVPRALRHHRIPMRNQIQLYYSFSDSAADPHLTPAGCVEDSAAQSQRQLIHIRPLTLKEEGGREQSRTKEEETCLNGQEDEELSLDPHVLISYHRGPVLLGQPIRVSVNLRANFSAEFVVIRLKVKKGLVSMVAQRTMTSDLWAVSLERSQGSNHDVVSILCHKHSTHTHSPTPRRGGCLSVDGPKGARGARRLKGFWSTGLCPFTKKGAAVSAFIVIDMLAIPHERTNHKRPSDPTRVHFGHCGP
ncbi:hypothetical protein FQN60_011577, partial [Etheostoma spectabile]